jgi:hypothetical protein
MRRLLSPVRLLVIHLPTAGAWLPLAPAAFSRLFSPTVSCPRWAGAVPQFRPSPLFRIGGEQDDNHSWFPDRG